VGRYLYTSSACIYPEYLQTEARSHLDEFLRAWPEASVH